jgi:phosphatidylinositol glycan class N
MWTEMTKFLVLSLVFHLLYTYSIFDIYFTSPVVHPARRYSSSNALGHLQDNTVSAKPAAKRLVLIVGDGLRADTLFKSHDAAFLPAWAEEDMSLHGRLRSETALQPSKNWTQASSTTSSFVSSFFAAPHIRQAAKERGAWGVSHTRVPTESRPGHVALIAGMYEDVSAVTKGE